MSWMDPLEEWTRRLEGILKIDIILTSDFRIIINLETDLILREIAIVLNSYIHCCKLSLLQLLHSCLNHGSKGSQSKYLANLYLLCLVVIGLLLAHDILPLHD